MHVLPVLAYTYLTLAYSLLQVQSLEYSAKTCEMHHVPQEPNLEQGGHSKSSGVKPRPSPAEHDACHPAEEQGVADSQQETHQVMFSNVNELPDDVLQVGCCCCSCCT